MQVAALPKYSPAELLDKVREALGPALESAEIRLGDPVIHSPVERLYEAIEKLKSHPDLDFAMLTSVTAVQWPHDAKEYELVYHLRSLTHNLLLAVKSRVARDEPAPSLTPLYKAADWQEREVWDLMGVKFEGHPDLRRILMPEGYPWHPLRKEFPVGGPDFPIDAFQTDAHHQVREDEFWGEPG